MKIQVMQHALRVKKLGLCQVRRESLFTGTDPELKTHCLDLARVQKQKKTSTDFSAVVADPAIKELKCLSDFICRDICSRGGWGEQLIKL